MQIYIRCRTHILWILITVAEDIYFGFLLSEMRAHTHTHTHTHTK